MYDNAACPAPRFANINFFTTISQHKLFCALAISAVCLVFLAQPGRAETPQSNKLAQLTYEWTNSTTATASATSDCVQLIGGANQATPRKIAVAGNYAYLTDLDSGLQIIDISSPSAPTPISRFSTPQFTLDVATAGGYAYLVGYYGLRIVDVSVPTAPSQVGSIEGIAPWRVVVSGNYAYAVTNGANNGLRVIDVSDPAIPIVVSSFNLQGAGWGIDVVGGYAFVVNLEHGLQIIDISSPTSPTLVGTFEMQKSAKSVAVSGSFAYIADDYGLQIIDVSLPSQPTLTGSLGIPGGSAFSISLKGDFAYLVGDYGLKIVYVGASTTPALAGSFPVPEIAFGVTLTGDYAYVAKGNGLLILQQQCSATCCTTPGDADNDGSFNIADVTFGISRVFSGGGAPACQDAADANGDGAFNIADVTFGIARVFNGGPAPICGVTGM